LCVDVERLADEPIVFTTEPVLDRDVVSCVEGFNVATMSFALNTVPVQQTITVDDIAVSLACTSDAGVVQCTVPATVFGACSGDADVDLAAAGVHAVVVTAQDLLGNVARGAMALTLDVTPPALLSDSTQVSLFPGNDNPRRAYVILDGEALTAATDGTVATIGFGLSEAAIVNEVVAGPVALLDQSIASAFVQLTPTVTSTWPEGALVLVASVVDTVGNAATIDLGASLLVDRTPPPELNVDTVVLQRQPWGTAEQTAAHLVVEGAVGATQEPLAVINVVLESGTFLQTRAASDGSFAVNGVGDSRTASVVVVDAAGNASAPVDVRRVRWTATLNGKVPASTFENPNVLLEVPHFGPSLQSPFDREVRTPAAVTAIDGQAVTTSASLLFTPRKFSSEAIDIHRHPVVGRDERTGRLITTGGRFRIGFDDQVYVVDDTVSVLGTSDLPAIGDAGSAYDKARGVFVVFGGRSSAGVSGDTWESADGLAWHQVASGPPAREFVAAAYDENRAAVVVFGGKLGASLLGDTWAWDGTTWTEVTSATSPSARSGAALAFLPGTGLVLFGGSTTGNVLSSETWVLAADGWTRVTTRTTPPSTEQAGMALDPVTNTVLMFGGADPAGGAGLNRTWTFDGSDWTEHTTRTQPNPRLAFGMATDDDNGRVVLVAGQENVPTIGGAFAGFQDVWQWDGAWSRIDVNRTDSPTIQSRGVAFDPVRSEVVLFGGAQVGGAAQLVNATHTYNGTTFTAKSPAFNMSASFSSSLAAFRGGVFAIGVSDTQTFRWSGSNWAVAAGDPPDGSAQLVTDKANDRILAIGAGKTSSYNGTTWTVVCTFGGAALCPRSGAFAAFDELRAVVVAFDGVSVLTFNGSTWVDDGATQLPEPATAGTLVFDQERGAMLMVRTSIGGAFDVHAYRDGVFTKVPLVDDIVPRAAAAIVYDGVNRQVAVIGGNSSATASTTNEMLVVEPDAPPAHLLRVALASAGRGTAAIERVSLNVAAVDVDVWVWVNGAWDAVEVVDGVAAVEDVRVSHLPFGEDGSVFFAWTPRTAGIGSSVATDAVSAVVDYRR
jgi:hypothetical protein